MINRALLHLIALAALPRFFSASGTWRGHGWFRCAEISDQGMTGKVPPIVHTAAAFDPSAQEAAR
jgi:hypothetical protein